MPEVWDEWQHRPGRQQAIGDVRVAMAEPRRLQLGHEAPELAPLDLYRHVDVLRRARCRTDRDGLGTEHEPAQTAGVQHTRQRS
jgi:hypothetical protein